MNISVHLPDSLAQRLDEYLDRESTTISKDALIAKCIESFLAGQSGLGGSPQELLPQEDEQEGLANGWSKEFLNWVRQDEVESDEELEFDRLPWREFEF